jgi:hypothetical protein
LPQKLLVTSERVHLAILAVQQGMYDTI